MFKITIGLILFCLVGCGYQQDLDKVMGRSPESAPSSPKLDCDLIFPAPAPDSLSP